MAESDETLRTRMRHPAMRRLFEYWLAKRGARLAPARADIDPVDIPYALGDLLMLDVEPGADANAGGDGPLFRYRLTGSHIVQLTGYDLIGGTTAAIPDAANRAYLEAVYRRAVAERAPMLVEHHRPIQGRPRGYALLVLPLSSDAAAIDILMVHQIYDDPPRRAPAAERS
jgi:hypothetical protein